MSELRDCPKELIEVRRNTDGTLDEIVAVGYAGNYLIMHLERMTDTAWWMSVDSDKCRQVVHFKVVDGKLVVDSWMDE
jgi:hypothetical protein